MTIYDELIKEALQTGVIICGAKGCGKSNSAKVLASELIKNPNIQVRIFDTVQNWVHGFESILYQKINENTGQLYIGERNVLYDLELLDLEKVMETIGTIVTYDYSKQRILKSKNEMKKWIVYFIEEAQNVLGTYSLSKESGKLWVKMISESRNFNMAFIFVAQRMSDVSTKVIERANGYCFGRTSGDNDKKKIARIVGDAIIETRLENEEWIRISGDKISDEVTKLVSGEFIYFNGKVGKYIKFPLYSSNTTPIKISNGEY